MSTTPYRGMDIGNLPTLRTMESVSREVAPTSEERSIPVSSITFGDHPLMTVDGQELTLTKQAGTTFFKALEIPYKYAERCPAHILRPQVQHWVNQSEKFRSGYFLTTDGDDGRIEASQFLSKDQGYIPLHRLIDHLGETYDDRVQVRHVNVQDPRNQSISFVLRDFCWNMSMFGGGDGTETPDLIYGGVTIDHSPVGERATSIEGYLFRLWCSNGAVMKEKGGSISRHLASDVAKVKGKFLSAVEEVTGKLEGNFRLLAETGTKAAPTADKVLRSLSLLGKKVPAKIADRFREIVDINPPQTYYEMLNLLTFLAHEYGDSPRVVRRIEETGGAMIQHHNSCGSCGRLL